MVVMTRVVREGMEQRLSNAGCLTLVIYAGPALWSALHAMRCVPCVACHALRAMRDPYKRSHHQKRIDHTALFLFALLCRWEKLFFMRGT